MFRRGPHSRMPDRENAPPECYTIEQLPYGSPLFRDWVAGAEVTRGWYAGGPLDLRWQLRDAGSDARDRGVARSSVFELATLLTQQAEQFGAAQAAFEHIEALRNGAAAVVTGQQVGLFGGPLLTLLKAATCIARAAQASRTTGRPHVPVFWLATEDHDLAEVDHAVLLGKTEPETLRAELHRAAATTVGDVLLTSEIESLLDHASELLGWAPVADLLRECYLPSDGYTPTMGLAFGRLLTAIFREHGLVVMDAAGRDFHALGASTLRAAIERADELHALLQERSRAIEAAGYEPQVLVAPGGSLLFLLNEHTGERQPLRRTGAAVAGWKAGQQTYSTADLLAVLDAAPERLSPNALLRPVFQDTLLPTAAYIGGPAEIAYFAQSEVLYRAILGRVTPVLPRLSATLVEPAIATVMDRHEVSLPQAMTTAPELAQRLGARAMPIEGKRRISAAGNSLETELDALLAWTHGMDESLGRSAEVSASKMRYQMNRLRRMAAGFELQKEASLAKRAAAITLNLFPGGHLQERTLAGVWFLARFGDGLAERLIAEADDPCPGHRLIRI
jgi:bacillithiol biosynthesis cysteine-adding enzyme BshC